MQDCLWGSKGKNNNKDESEKDDYEHVRGKMENYVRIQKNGSKRIWWKENVEKN